jgi:hypothetical protein
MVPMPFLAPRRLHHRGNGGRGIGQQMQRVPAEIVHLANGLRRELGDVNEGIRAGCLQRDDL